MTIAGALLRETARMRKEGSFDTATLCWSPAELESLAMFAIEAKNKLALAAAQQGGSDG